MRSRARVVVGLLALVAVLLLPDSAHAQATPGACAQGVLPGGARSLMCVPSAGWNGQLVVYAHGYVAPDLPLDFYQLTTADGTSLPVLVQSLGYAFATTSYRRNGLAILEGVADIRELVAAFAATHGPPLRTHLAGVSEGGLVATLLAERSPDLFHSALATCGPIGSFRAQVNYLGDFRVLFDYFFPGVIPGSPVNIPAGVRANWTTVYAPLIAASLSASPSRALELMRVSGVAYDPANPATLINSAINVLWYNVFGTNDAAARLGGNPFGNRLRWYFGSTNDLRLNLLVRRFDTASAAAVNLARYETTGKLRIPLVTMHTTADEVVPIAHELFYLGKADRADRGLFLPVPIARYGHCNFTAAELALGFLFTSNLP